MARRGREKLFGKNLDANSAKRLTVTVLTAPFWVTRSYKRLRAFRLRQILGEATRWGQVPPFWLCACGSVASDHAAAGSCEIRQRRNASGRLRELSLGLRAGRW